MDDIDSYLALWTAVLQRTIDDLALCDEVAQEQRDAARWVLSDANHPCSFNWVCDMLDIGELIYTTMRRTAREIPHDN